MLTGCRRRHQLGGQTCARPRFPDVSAAFAQYVFRATHLTIVYYAAPLLLVEETRRRGRPIGEGAQDLLSPPDSGDRRLPVHVRAPRSPAVSRRAECEGRGARGGVSPARAAQGDFQNALSGLNPKPGPRPLAHFFFALLFRRTAFPNRFTDSGRWLRCPSRADPQRSSARHSQTRTQLGPQLLAIAPRPEAGSAVKPRRDHSINL